ncbi:YphA family membrane protein [Virgibacillus kimchii]
MTSGLLFYWFSWILIISILFFMKKNNKRKILAYWVLFVIICSNFYQEIGFYHISVSFLLIMTGSAIWMIKLPRLMYQLLCSFTVAILYTAIHFWLHIAPVWLFLPIIAIIALSCSLFTVLLVKEAEYRKAICLFGISCGEILYSITMSSYGFQRSIGEMVFFDYIAGILLIFAILGILQYTTVKINNLVKQIQLRWQNE